jgi:hypothetical protein
MKHRRSNLESASSTDQGGGKRRGWSAKTETLLYCFVLKRVGHIALIARCVVASGGRVQAHTRPLRIGRARSGFGKGQHHTEAGPPFKSSPRLPKLTFWEATGTIRSR